MAELIGREMPLRRRGNLLFASCVFHNEKTPSLCIYSDHYHCHGCGAHGDAIAWVRARRNLSFTEAVRELLGMPQRIGRREKGAERVQNSTREDNPHIKFVRQIWAATQPLTDRTAAGMYLNSRGILLSGLCADVRAHPDLDTGEPGGGRLPALVAAVRDSRGEICAVQRIWVLPRHEVGPDDPVGHTGATHLQSRKKTLGRLKDGCVRLGSLNSSEPVLGLAEGVETGLSAQEMFFLPVWATCGLARWGMPAHLTAPDPQGRQHKVAERAPTIWLPPETRRLILYADNGLVAHQSADYSAWYWSRLGLECRIDIPESKYSDWQDVHRERGYA